MDENIIYVKISDTTIDTNITIDTENGLLLDENGEEIYSTIINEENL